MLVLEFRVRAIVLRSRLGPGLLTLEVRTKHLSTKRLGYEMSRSHLCYVLSIRKGWKLVHQHSGDSSKICRLVQI